MYPVYYTDKAGNARSGFIDAEGKLLLETPFKRCYPFVEDLACINRHEGGSGFIDRRGQIVVEPKYLYCDAFSEALAAVGIQDGVGESQYGFVDSAGCLVLPLRYSSVSRFSDGVCFVSEPGDGPFYSVIDSAGKRIVALAGCSCGAMVSGSGLLPCWEEKATREIRDCEKWKSGFRTTSGEWAIPPIYQHVECFHEGLAYVLPKGRNSQGTVINTKGEALFTVPGKDAGGSRFSEGLMACCMMIPKKGVLWGYCNTSGELVIDYRYESAKEFLNGLALVSEIQKGKELHGFIDKTGNWVIAATYKVIQNDGFIGALVAINPRGERTYINRQGVAVWGPQLAAALGYQKAEAGEFYL